MFDSVNKITASCSCGHVHSLLTEECVVSSNAAGEMGEYIRKKGFSSPAIICDENTQKFTGKILEYISAPIKTVAGNAHATEVFTALVDEFIADKKPDVLIACGSGSVHDITRYCACENKIPFISYPTAASVDGFVSGVAAMTWHGQKLTFESVPPIAAFADPDVFCTAPSRLTASGVGDVYGKYISLFDWKVGVILTGEYFCPSLYDMEKEAINDLTDALLHRDTIGEKEYTTKVMNALLLSGLAIQLCGNSRPASGAEHHMSHLWEMHRLNDRNDGLHGEQVAVGLMCVAKRYAEAFERGIDYDKLASPDVAAAMDIGYLEPVFRDLTDGILKENLPDGTIPSSSLSKIKVDNADETDAALRASWAEVPSLAEIDRLLTLAGTPRTTADIGLEDSAEFVARSLRYASYVRNRLTLLKALNASGQ